MKPYVINPTPGTVIVMPVFKQQGLLQIKKIEPAVVGGDPFMIDLCTSHVTGDSIFQRLGEVTFVPGNLYTWKGEVAIVEFGSSPHRHLLASEGSWFVTHYFDVEVETVVETELEANVSRPLT